MSGVGRVMGLLLVLLAAETRAAKPVTEGPVAVLPFKNLNQDATLEWMRLGIAETLLSDLRASGRVQVVEREQLGHALAELALQEARGTEESTAARVGRMVGARTVLLGSFQRAGNQLRLNARLVAVETGVVLDTAKVTGKLEQIFALQDDLVVRLLGTGDTKAPRRRRRTGPRVVKAYELYGRALASVSETKRVALLREAVKAEPDFTYAREDLIRLEARLREYRRAAAAAREERRSRLLAMLGDESLTPEERGNAAFQLFVLHKHARSWWGLRRDAERIRGMTLPERISASVREQALESLARAHRELRQREAALQVTERFLREFPGSVHTLSMEVQANRLIAELRERPAGRATAARVLAENDAWTTQARQPGPSQAYWIRKLELDHCTLRCEHFLFEEARLVCRSFIESWRHHDDTDAHVDVSIALMKEITALAEMGRFTEANASLEELESFVDAHPDIASQRNLVEGARNSLPSDDEEATAPGTPEGPSGGAVRAGSNGKNP
ncbi:hypothetical protein F0U59_22505 [Archangium gephyra]|nr:hypothetical protein F0U59_22505 [Archangium gephyra]